LIPPWCKTGKLAARVELLRQALASAGAKGLDKFDDINPCDADTPAWNRGFDALFQLTYSKEAVQVGDRVYLARFAPGAAASNEAAPDEPASEPASEPQPAQANPIDAALQKAGAAGLSTFELMQATGLDAVGLFPVLTPLRESGSVIERDGRYYHAAVAED
jgi:hypothetical protein